MILARIIYKLPRDAQTAVKNLDGHVFKGTPLKAKALETGPAPAPRVDNYIDKNARLIVRNLPWKVGVISYYKFLRAWLLSDSHKRCYLLLC